MITITCLIGVVVLPSLLPVGTAAAVAVPGENALIANAHRAAPHSSSYFRISCVCTVLSLSNDITVLPRCAMGALVNPVPVRYLAGRLVGSVSAIGSVEEIVD